MLLDRIELFVTVAKHQNLAKTARQMHVSASSVCQRLKSLESDFGVKLYKRNKEGIELTGAGETVLTTVSDVLNKLDSLKKSLNADSENGVRSLTIGGTFNVSAKHLPEAIGAFKKQHPEIEVRFLTSDLINIEKRLRDFEVEIGMMQSPSESPDFEMEPFAVDHLVFFAHPTHPLAKKRKLEREDLAEIPLIVRDGRSTTYKMLQELKRMGLPVKVALRCATPDAVKAAVRRKMGIGVLFYDLIEEDIKRKDLRTLKFSGLPTFVGHSFIVYSKTQSLSYAANEFLALLRSMKTRIKNPLTGSEPNEEQLN